MIRRAIQTLAFFRKELAEILHQPRLVLTLVIGPFLIMAVFGVGYKDEVPVMRAAVVVPPGSMFEKEIERYEDDLRDAVDLVVVTNKPSQAARMLVDDEVDVVITFPDEPLATVRAGEHPVIRVQHTRLDPLEQTAIIFATDYAVDRMNRQLLSLVVERGQAVAPPAAQALDDASGALDALSRAARSGDPVAWSRALQDARTAVDDLDGSVGTQTVIGDELGPPGEGSIDESLSSLRSELDDLASDPSGPDAATADRLSALSTSFAQIDATVRDLATVDPDVLVRPLVGDVSLAVSGVDDVIDWYAPAAVVLILQQFGIAFGALSFVRERQLGIHELFKVAPIGAGQSVVGKYLAYMVVGGLVGAVLTAAVVAALDVPMSGSLADLAVVMSLVLAASIGLGLVISLLSSTDAQAVQYTMIVLLASLFFSGFFLAVAQMVGAAQVLAYLLPVTYGMVMLRDVMLRGAGLDPVMLIGLAGYALLMFVLTLLGARRRMMARAGVPSAA